MVEKNKTLLAVAAAVLVLAVVGVAFLLMPRGLGPRIAAPETVAPSGPAKAELTYAPGATLVDDGAMRGFLRTEGEVYVFRGGPPSGIQQGKVAVFAGKSIRRIDKVERAGGETRLTTSPALFTDAFTDATVSWEHEYDFSQLAADDLKGMTIWWGDVPLALAADAGEETGGDIQFTGTVNGVEITLGVRPAGDRLNLNFEAVHSIGGRRASRAWGDGYISNFRTSGDIEVADAALEEFSYDQQGLNGELNVHFASTLGTDTLQLAIPASISLPLRVGVVPIDVRLKANMRIVPEVRPGTSSQASFRVRYDADQGFSFAGERAEPTSTVRNHEVEVTDETVSAGAIAVGFGFGLEFPRMELGVFGETVVPYFAIDNYAHSVYTFDPACQQGGLRTRAVAGVSLSFFGVGYARETELWKREDLREVEGSRC